MSKSHWRFSGRNWAGWTATWTGLILAVVSYPGAPDKHAALSVPAGKAGHPVTASASGVSVKMSGIDFGELPPTAFGDYDPDHGRH